MTNSERKKERERKKEPGDRKTGTRGARSKTKHIPSLWAYVLIPAKVYPAFFFEKFPIPSAGVSALYRIETPGETDVRLYLVLPGHVIWVWPIWVGPNVGPYFSI